MKSVPVGGHDLKGGKNNGGLVAGATASGSVRKYGRGSRSASGYAQETAGAMPSGKPSGLKNAKRSASGYGAACA